MHSWTGTLVCDRLFVSTACVFSALGFTTLLVLMTMKDLVLGMFAATTRRSTLVGPTGVSFVAVALALLTAHVLRSLTATAVPAAAARVTATVGVTVIVRSEHRGAIECQQGHSADGDNAWPG